MLFILLFLLSLPLSAQSTDTQSDDSLRLQKEMEFLSDGITTVLSAGVQTWVGDSYNRRPGTFPHYGHSALEVTLPLAPLAATWTMKAAGVRSRSKIDRMLLSNAMALGITTGLTYIAKSATREMSPDGYSRNSFPSANTAVAFASATILAREYGYISPWISIGGYATATATEVIATHRNRNWINDMLTGCAIGTVSTNLAYFITDRIIGSRGINTHGWENYDSRFASTLHTPSGFTLFCGTEFGGSWIDLDGIRYKPGTATVAGADVSWFLTDHWAVEAVFRSNDVPLKPEPANLESTHLSMYHANVGCKFQFLFDLFEIPIPLPPMNVAFRTLTGMRLTSPPSPSTPSTLKPEFGAGVDFTFINAPRYTGGFSFDYMYANTSLMPHRYCMGGTWKVLF